jgi:hypothetical protein
MIKNAFWILVPETTKHGAKMVKLLLALAVLLSSLLSIKKAEKDVGAAASQLLVVILCQL